MFLFIELRINSIRAEGRIFPVRVSVNINLLSPDGNLNWYLQMYKVKRKKCYSSKEYLSVGHLIINCRLIQNYLNDKYIFNFWSHEIVFKVYIYTINHCKPHKMSSM